MDLIKNKVILVMGALIISLSFLLYHTANIASKNKEKADALEETVSNVNQKLKITEVRLNDSTKVKMAQVKDLQVTCDNLKAMYSDAVSASGVKVKYIDRITTVSTEVSNTDTVICQVDTFGGIKANYNDGFVKIGVDIDKARNAVIDYTVKDSLTIINYQKRHSILFGLIKWNDYMGTEIINHNPKGTFTTVQSCKTIK